MIRGAEMNVGNCEYCGAEGSPVFKVYRSHDKFHCICEKCYNKYCFESVSGLERKWGGKKVEFQKVAGESMYFAPCHYCGKLTKDFMYYKSRFGNVPIFTHSCYHCRREQRKAFLSRRAHR